MVYYNVRTFSGRIVSRHNLKSIALKRITAEKGRNLFLEAVKY